MELKPEGYAVDRKFADILYVPEGASFDLRTQAVTWTNERGAQQLKLLAGHTYVRPSGYRVHMEQPPGRVWRLVGTRGEGTFCHKPCTVSGGGKSEISKSLSDAILTGPVFVADFKKDFDKVAKLLSRDYSQRFRDAERNGTDTRPLLSRERSLGSVIKLLTPSPKDYADEFNEWLEGIPQYVKELVFVVKRFHKAEWGKNWREHFSVDIVNGVLLHDQPVWHDAWALAIVAAWGAAGFLLAHALPFFFVASRLIWRSRLSAEQWRLGAVVLTTAHAQWLVTATILFNAAFRVWPRLLTTYGGF